jgi:hypothetical protein
MTRSRDVDRPSPQRSARPPSHDSGAHGAGPRYQQLHALDEAGNDGEIRLSWPALTSSILKSRSNSVGYVGSLCCTSPATYRPPGCSRRQRLSVPRPIHDDDRKELPLRYPTPSKELAHEKKNLQGDETRAPPKPPATSKLCREMRVPRCKLVEAGAQP